MLNKIKDELKYIREVKIEIAKNIKTAPDGKLRCAINKGCFQYYIGARYLKSEEKQIAVELAKNI